jgi:hypothetical protein
VEINTSADKKDQEQKLEDLEGGNTQKGDSIQKHDSIVKHVIVRKKK